MTKEKRNLLLLLLLVLCGAYYFCVEYLDDPLDVAWWWLTDKFSATSPGSLEKWTDYAADSFAGGSGTEADPYLIATAEQLAYLAKTVNESKHWWQVFIKLTSDIDLAGREWVPIGTPEVPFLGTLRGEGHTISNLTITGNMDYQGLFGVAQYNLQVFNLIMRNVNVKGRRYVGALVGASLKHSRYANVSISGCVFGTCDVGGVVGYADQDYIEQCEVSIEVVGKKSVGGIIGLMKDGILKDCSFVGSVKGDNEVGGLIGYQQATVFPASSHPPAPPLFAKIMSSCSSGDITGKKEVGGVVGRIRYAWLLDCTVYGKIDGRGKVGGIFGKNRGANVLYCSTFADIPRHFLSFFRRTGSLGGSLWGGVVSKCAWNRDNQLPMLGSLRLFAFKERNIAFERGRLSENIGLVNLTRVEILSRDILLNAGIEGFEIIPRNLVGLHFESYRDRLRVGWGTSAPSGRYTLFLDDGKETKIILVNVQGDFQDLARPVLNWIDFASNSFSGGSGTEKDPYLIGTPEELARFAKICDVGSDLGFFTPSPVTSSFKLIDDIDLSGRHWVPVKKFSGVFDGNNKRICNMTSIQSQETTDALGYGFFRRVVNGRIQNLQIQNANILARGYAGVLAGMSAYSTVENCNVSGNIYGYLPALLLRVYWGGALNGASAHPPRRTGYVGKDLSKEGVSGGVIGGFVGLLHQSAVCKSASSVSIRSFYSIGGLVGEADDSCLVGNKVTGIVTIEGDAMSAVNELAGNWKDTIFNNCSIDNTVEIRKREEIFPFMKLNW